MTEKFNTLNRGCYATHDMIFMRASMPCRRMSCSRANLAVLFGEISA